MKDEWVRTIVELEWAMFSQVENQGGRAACQNDPGTFSIMRSAQLLAWNLPLLGSYRGDLLAAKDAGRNLLTEKYARMMATTYPEEYARLAPHLPPLTPRAKGLIEKIGAIQMAWAEEGAAAYPAVAGNGRPLGSGGDSRDATSAETYLKGELATYSIGTLECYLELCRQLQAKGQNLCVQIWENTARAYGYPSLEAAEKAQKKPGP